MLYCSYMVEGRFESPHTDTSRQESSHHEKRERLLESIDQKASLIGELRSTAQENARLSPEELESVCDKKREEIKRSFDPELVSRWEEAQKLEERSHEVHSRIEQLARTVQERVARETLEQKGKESERDEEEYKEALQVAEDTVPAYALLDPNFNHKWLTQEEESAHQKIAYEHQQIETKLAEYRDVLDANNVQFLDQTSTFLDSLVSKRDVVTDKEIEYAKDPSSLKEYLSSAISPVFQDVTLDDERCHVEFVGYNINIFLPSEEYAKVKKGRSQGVHFNGVPVNIIRLKEEETPASSRVQRIVQHEENHNLTDSFAEPPMYHEELISRINKKIERIQDLREKAPHVIVENEMSRLKREIVRYANRNYHEVLADIEHIQQGDTRNYRHRFLESIGAIEHMLENVEDKEIRSQMESALEEVEHDFVRKVQTLRDVFAVAEKLDATDDATNALILLKNEKPRTIERYIKYKTGESAYEIRKQLLPVLADRHKTKDSLIDAMLSGQLEESDRRNDRIYAQLRWPVGLQHFLQEDRLHELATTLQQTDAPPELSNEERETINRWMQQGISTSLLNVLNVNPDNIDQAVDDLRTIVDTYNLDTTVLEALEEHGHRFIFLKRFKTALQHDAFEDLEQTVKQWSLPRDEFASIVKDTVIENIETGLLDSYREQYDDVHESPLGRFLAQYGLTDTIPPRES